MTRRTLIGRAVAIAAGVAMVAVPTLSASATSPTPKAASPIYPCSSSDNSQFQSGTGYGVDVSAIGWLGNDQGAVACLGGSFFAQNSIDKAYGYGIYNYTPTTWTNADGYLPALVTSFSDHGAKVSITNFGDRVEVGGNPFVLVYSRVAVTNPTKKTLSLNPQPSAGLVSLGATSNKVAPGATVDHDYVAAVDRFGNTYAYPTTSQLKAAGGWSQHFAHMRSFWNHQLAGITQLNLPDPQLVSAYKADFIYTQIDRSGVDLDTGTNGYHAEYEHDVIGILANMFNEGDFSDAHVLLNEADTVVGTNGQYSDGLWTYPWLWAVYQEKTGDLSWVEQHFDTPGPLGATKQPSIEATAHQLVADRTGPGGIMEETSDIDANGYWTSDNLEALLGLHSYAYLAKEVGNASEATWAQNEYTSLQKAVFAQLAATAAKYHLNYLPCSMVEPNTQNRCADPLDANWAAPGVYTNAAWHQYLIDGSTAGPAGKSMSTWVDITMKYGFARSRGVLPSTTFGGYPGEGFWSTAYNAGYGAWGLSTSNFRDESILAYEWMIANDQSGPYAWWEGSSAPTDSTPWTGNHPTSSGGASPHSWGIALAAQGLLDSLASQATDGTLIVGRGVPTDWLAGSKTVGLTNFPTTDGHRIGLSITTAGKSVTLKIKGTPSGPVVFNLPVFAGNIASASGGKINHSAGTVTIPASTSQVTVKLKKLTLTPAATSLRIDPAGAVHVGSGGADTISATLADSGPGALAHPTLALLAPRGWKVTAVETNRASSLGAGETLTGTWTLKAPGGSKGTVESAQLRAQAAWTDTNTGRRESATAGQLGSPGISGLAPAKAGVGQTVTITGSGFGTSQGTISQVEFTDGGTVWGLQGNLPALDITGWSNHRITFEVPSGSGTDGNEYQVVPGSSASVQVVTAGGSSNVAHLSISS